MVNPVQVSLAMYTHPFSLPRAWIAAIDKVRAGTTDEKQYPPATYTEEAQVNDESQLTSAPPPYTLVAPSSNPQSPSHTDSLPPGSGPTSPVKLMPQPNAPPMGSPMPQPGPQPNAPPPQANASQMGRPMHQPGPPMPQPGPQANAPLRGPAMPNPACYGGTMPGGAYPPPPSGGPGYQGTYTYKPGPAPPRPPPQPPRPQYGQPPPRPPSYPGYNGYAQGAPPPRPQYYQPAPLQPQYCPPQPQYRPPPQPQYRPPSQPQYRPPSQPQYRPPPQPQYRPPPSCQQATNNVTVINLPAVQPRIVYR